MVLDHLSCAKRQEDILISDTYLPDNSLSVAHACQVGYAYCFVSSATYALVQSCHCDEPLITRILHASSYLERGRNASPRGSLNAAEHQANRYR
jgi:hypothetical protein